MVHATERKVVDVVLVGGGHAHVHVMRAFGMQPDPAVRLTLIARDLETPYSGMLPGHVAGLYDRDDIHIDLQQLARATNTRLIHAEAVGLDRAAKRVLLQGRAPIAYDVVSLDTGIVPPADAIPGAAEHALAVKPIGSFLARFDALRARCAAPDGPRRIAMIGGGAGGVELLLSVRTRLRDEARIAGLDPEAFAFTLVTGGSLLAGHNRAVRAAFGRVLGDAGVTVHDRRVASVHADRLTLDDGTAVPCDAALLVTGAAPPAWFRTTGLDLDTGGFIAVTPTLQSTNDADVFAVGDCASMTGSPREKAGVFAVRQGPPLARNLLARARGEDLSPYRPQASHLALISTGTRYAIASRGALKLESAWLWRLKDVIDQRFMAMYRDIQPMPMPPMPVDDDMRCGGCAAKVGPAPLANALERLSGAAPREDAAIIPVPSDRRSLVQTVDFFRDFIGDPFVFGQVAANHALNDVFAMGGTPHHALAIVTVPPGRASGTAETLFQVLAGAKSCFDTEGVQLAGGHSGEGAQLACGFSVTGFVEVDRALRKSGLQAGDALILTRPLGTGILFAADMRARARARWIEAALTEMCTSNRAAMQALLDHGATAATDVSGFGLIGHLAEMLSASGMAATLDAAAVPLYAGVSDLAAQGFASTLLPDNLANEGFVAGVLPDALKAILFDPQTAGGLLAGVPADRAESCVAALHAAGIVHAAIIGRAEAGMPRVRLALRQAQHEAV